MKQLLEDILLVLNNIPNRKLHSKDWTTYDLAKGIEEKLFILDAILTVDNLMEELKQQTDNEHMEQPA